MPPTLFRMNSLSVGRAPLILIAAFQQMMPKPASNPYRHVGRNDPCPCGSGKKFKRCCGQWKVSYGEPFTPG